MTLSYIHGTLVNSDSRASSWNNRIQKYQALELYVSGYDEAIRIEKHSGRYLQAQEHWTSLCVSLFGRRLDRNFSCRLHFGLELEPELWLGYLRLELGVKLFVLLPHLFNISLKLGFDVFVIIRFNSTKVEAKFKGVGKAE